MEAEQINTMIDAAVGKAIKKHLPPKEDKFLSTAEAAQFCGLQMQTLRKMASRNKIPFHRAGGRLRFLESELREWMLNS